MRACAPLERTPLLRIERGDAPTVLNGDVPTALNGDASVACFMGRACAPLERTPLPRIELKEFREISEFSEGLRAFRTHSAPEASALTYLLLPTTTHSYLSLPKKITYPPAHHNLLSEWCRCGASQKKPSRDSTLTYSPRGFTFRDVPQMRHYHNKLLEC